MPANPPHPEPLSPLLHTDDVRAIVRILGNLIDQPHLSVNERRAMLMNEIAQLIGADKWIWYNSKLDAKGLPAFYFQLNNGFKPDHHLIFSKLGSLQEAHDLYFEPIKEQAGKSNFTVVRNDYIPADYWFSHPIVIQYFAAAEIADFLISIYHLGHGIMSSVGLYHNDKSRVFGIREKTIVHVILSEIDWLHRDNAIVPGAYTVPELPPRERLVLLQLLSGNSTKQIAAALKISQHTVNDYLKSLHKRFNVSSRSELLAQFISGTARKNPA